VQSLSVAQGWSWQSPLRHTGSGTQAPPLLSDGLAVDGDPGHGVALMTQSDPDGHGWPTSQTPFEDGHLSQTQSYRHEWGRL
jgi:hypothetical protein